MDHVGEFASASYIGDNREENPISPNSWRMQKNPAGLMAPRWTPLHGGVSPVALGRAAS